MSQQVPKLNRCPDCEALSAFCDGLPVDDAVTAHIGECPECAAAVEDYRRIGAMIGAAAGELPDMDALNERIRARIRVERARAPRYNFVFVNTLTKVAAVLVVAVLTGVSGIHIGRRIWPAGDEPPAYTAENRPPSESPAVSTRPMPDLPYYTGFNFDLRNANSVPIQNLAAANYGDNAPVFSAVVKELAQPVIHVEIADHVRQVWVMPDAARNAAVLRDFLARQGVGQSRLAATSRGTLALSAVLSKEQLIKLVRFMDSRKFDLVSAAAPQPEQKYFFGSPGDMVNYTAEFVEN